MPKIISIHYQTFSEKKFIFLFFTRIISKHSNHAENNLEMIGSENKKRRFFRKNESKIN